MSTAANDNPSSPSVPGPAYASSPARLSEEELAVARYATAGLALLSGIVALGSLFTYWWLWTGAGTNIAFFPGPSFRTNGTFSSYASAGLGQVGGVFDAILALGAVAGLLLLVGGGWLLWTSVRHRPAPSRLPAGLTVAGVVLEAVSVFVAVLLVPWSFNASSGGSAYCAGWSGPYSPCKYFWGTGHAGGVGITFVGADGWIVMVGALALGVVGLLIWRYGRNPDGVPTAGV